MIRNSQIYDRTAYALSIALSHLNYDWWILELRKDIWHQHYLAPKECFRRNYNIVLGSDDIHNMVWIMLVIRFGGYDDMPDIGWLDADKYDQIIAYLNFLFSGDLPEDEEWPEEPDLDDLNRGLDS